MRPTVEEQLLGTCRILEKVVAPCVADPYARTMLDGLIANLRMLTGALPAVPGFLNSDNRATAALLAQLQSAAAPELAAAIALALQRPEPDSADMKALDQRNGELRELLSQALSGAGLTPALRAAALEHMSARASRAPMRYVSTASTPAATPKAT
jgi:hypothetical protein